MPEAAPAPAPAPAAVGQPVADCLLCQQCPLCIPIHEELNRTMAEVADLVNQRAPMLAAANAALRLAAQTVNAAQAQVDYHRAKLDSIITALVDLEAQLRDLGAGGPTGAASANVSFTPRPGWFEHDLGNGMKAWTRTEDPAELQAILSTMALQSAVASLRAMRDATLTELSIASDWLHEAQRRYWDTWAEWNQRLEDLEARIHELDLRVRELQIEHSNCVRLCAPVAEEPSPAIAVGAGALMVGGGVAVVLGAPFARDLCHEDTVVAATMALAMAGDLGIVGAFHVPLAAAAATWTAARRAVRRGRDLRRLALVLGTIVLLVSALASLPAGAGHVTILDACTGVDHPPFDRDYSDPGASQALVGVTTDLPPGSFVTGVMFSESGTAEAGAIVDDAGRAVLDFPLQEYGPHEFVLSDAEAPDHAIHSGAIAVGPEESPCSTAQLDAASQEPEPEPTPEPTATTDPGTAQQPTEPAATTAPTEDPTPARPRLAAPPALVAEPTEEPTPVPPTEEPTPTATETVVETAPGPAVALPPTTDEVATELGGGTAAVAFSEPCDEVTTGSGPLTGGGIVAMLLGATALGLVPTGRRREGLDVDEPDEPTGPEPGEEPTVTGGGLPPTPPTPPATVTGGGLPPTPPATEAGGGLPPTGTRTGTDADEAASRRREELAERDRRDIAQRRAEVETAERDARDAMVTEARDNVETAQEELLSATREVAELERQEREEGVVESVVDWFTDTDVDEEQALSQARSRQRQAADALRSAESELLVAQTSGLDSDERLRTVQRLLQEARSDLDRSRVTYRTAVANGAMPIDEGDRTRAFQLARAEATLHSKRIREEALMLAHTHLAPTRMDEVGSDVVSSTADELDRLGFEITRSRTERDIIPETSAADDAARSWLQSIDREHRIQQYRSLAALGTIVDPQDTGETPIEGPQRWQLEADRLAWLASYAESKAWDSADDRMRVATELRKELETTYRPLQYLGLGTVDMPEYFRALAHTIRRREEDIELWYTTEYLGQSAEAPDDALEFWWTSINTGIGTQGRIAGLGGDASQEAVRGRIASMHREADAAVTALNAAASTPDPSQLSAEHFEVLSTSGYIVQDPDGSLRYTLPGTEQLASAATAVDLPGASWLDVVSARTAGEMLLSVAVPQLAAARVAALAARLGTSARAVAALRFLADQGVGAALDVGFEYSRTGKVDVASLLAESVISSSLSSWARGLSEAAVGSGAAALARRSAGRADATLTDLLGDSRVRRAAYEFVAEASGLSAETLVSTVQLAVTRDGSLTADDILAMMVSNTMNRLAAKAGTATADNVEGLIDRLPAPLRSKLREHPLLARELTTSALVNADHDREASRAFDEVVGDRGLDTATGRVVAEALRDGRLTWEQLQRVYATRGSELDHVMTEVARWRNEFFTRITHTARELARERIGQHFRSELDRLLGDPESPENDRAIDELVTRYRDEMSRLDTDAPTRAWQKAVTALESIERATEDELRARYEADIVSRMRSKVEADPEGAWREAVEAEARLSEMTESQLREHFASQVSAELDQDLRGGRDVIVPGSAGPTSDVDRSWASEFLRRAAQEVIRYEMSGGRDGVLPPTTARAFDVNEYVNVMRTVGRLVTGRRDVDGLVLQTRTIDGHEVELTHADVVEANTLASAMLHMSPDERSRYQRNLSEGLDAESRRRHDAMFEHARESLAESDAALASEYASVARELGRSPDDPDVQLRARDRLYGRRMETLVRIEQELAGLPEESPEALELRSRWERLMNVALRDGIETYSDMVTLDILVTRMQTQKIDGRKLTVSELIEKADFVAGTGALEHLDASHLRGMLNDQVLMLMHHVHSYHDGHESPSKAVRSLAKYAERALLALNLQGRFDATDTTSPHRRLFEVSRELMKYKDEPTRQMEKLLELTGTDDPQSAVRAYLDLVETLPGMAGLTTAPRERRSVFSSSLLAREWARRVDGFRDTGELVSVLGDELVGLVSERQELEQELARLQRFSSTYRESDWAAAERVEDAVDVLDLRRRLLFGSRGRTERFVGDIGRTIEQELRSARQRQHELRSRFEPGRDLTPETRARIEWLQRRLESLREQESALSRRLEEGAAAATTTGSPRTWRDDLEDRLRELRRERPGFEEVTRERAPATVPEPPPGRILLPAYSYPHRAERAREAIEEWLEEFTPPRTRERTPKDPPVTPPGRLLPIPGTGKRTPPTLLPHPDREGIYLLPFYPRPHGTGSGSVVVPGTGPWIDALIDALRDRHPELGHWLEHTRERPRDGQDRGLLVPYQQEFVDALLEELRRRQATGEWPSAESGGWMLLPGSFPPPLDRLLEHLRERYPELDLDGTRPRGEAWRGAILEGLLPRRRERPDGATVWLLPSPARPAPPDHWTRRPRRPRLIPHHGATDPDGPATLLPYLPAPRGTGPGAFVVPDVSWAVDAFVEALAERLPELADWLRHTRPRRAPGWPDDDGPRVLPYDHAAVDALLEELRRRHPDLPGLSPERERPDDGERDPGGADLLLPYLRRQMEEFLDRRLRQAGQDPDGRTRPRLPEMEPGAAMLLPFRRSPEGWLARRIVVIPGGHGQPEVVDLDHVPLTSRSVPFLLDVVVFATEPRP